jgi:RNA polymerase sigma-70 factor (ECF subfamily)
VFVRLWKGLDRYDPRRRFDTWLYRITVNAAIDLIRSPGRKLVQPLSEDGPEPVETRGVDVDASLDLGTLQKAFKDLAAKLAPKQRTAFVLREIEGLETAEVARVMNVTESTVRNHLHQARRILRAGLERDYPGLVPGGGKANDEESAGGSE